MALPDQFPPVAAEGLGILRKLGMRAEAVADGVESIEAFKTLPYDLLLDVQMPEMDGLEATRMIRDPQFRPCLTVNRRPSTFTVDLNASHAVGTAEPRSRTSSRW